MTTPAKRKPNPITAMSDDELFAALREQVNLSRNTGKFNRVKTRKIAAEAQRRGWNLRQPSDRSSS